MLMKLTPGDELPLTLGRKVEPKGGLAMLTEAGKKVDDAIVRWIGEAIDPLTYASLGVTEADLRHEAAPKPRAEARVATDAAEPPAELDRYMNLLAEKPVTVGVDHSGGPDKTIMFRRWTPKQFVISNDTIPF